MGFQRTCPQSALAKLTGTMLPTCLCTGKHGAKEMMQPCLTYMHAISLVAHRYIDSIFCSTVRYFCFEASATQIQWSSGTVWALQGRAYSCSTCILLIECSCKSKS